MEIVNDTVRFTAVIKTREDEQRRFWGRAYIAKDESGAQVVDHSGDIIDTPEAMASLEAAFYDYVRDSRAGDLEHTEFGAAELIEGVAVTKEKVAAGLFPDGTPEGLLVGFQATDTPQGDALWEGVKSGRLKALSIVGAGRRVPV